MEKLNFEQMECVKGGSAKHYLCVGGMYAAGACFEPAIAVVSGGLGCFAFGLAWCEFADWVCGHAE